MLGLTTDDDTLVGVVLRNGYIQGDIRKGGLEADPCRHIYIKDELLYGLLNLSVSQFVISDEWGQEGIKI